MAASPLLVTNKDSHAASRSGAPEQLAAPPIQATHARCVLRTAFRLDQSVLRVAHAHTHHLVLYELRAETLCLWRLFACCCGMPRSGNQPPYQTVVRGVIPRKTRSTPRRCHLLRRRRKLRNCGSGRGSGHSGKSGTRCTVTTCAFLACVSCLKSVRMCICMQPPCFCACVRAKGEASKIARKQTRRTDTHLPSVCVVAVQFEECFPTHARTAHRTHAGYLSPGAFTRARGCRRPVLSPFPATAATIEEFRELRGKGRLAVRGIRRRCPASAARRMLESLWECGSKWDLLRRFTTSFEGEDAIDDGGVRTHAAICIYIHIYIYMYVWGRMRSGGTTGESVGVHAPSSRARRAPPSRRRRRRSRECAGDSRRTDAGAGARDGLGGRGRARHRAREVAGAVRARRVRVAPGQRLECACITAPPECAPRSAAAFNLCPRGFVCAFGPLSGFLSTPLDLSASLPGRANGGCAHACVKRVPRSVVMEHLGRCLLGCIAILKYYDWWDALAPLHSGMRHVDQLRRTRTGVCWSLGE